MRKLFTVLKIKTKGILRLIRADEVSFPWKVTVTSFVLLGNCYTEYHARIILGANKGQRQLSPPSDGAMRLIANRDQLAKIKCNSAGNFGLMFYTCFSCIGTCSQETLSNLG